MKFEEKMAGNSRNRIVLATVLIVAFAVMPVFLFYGCVDRNVYKGKFISTRVPKMPIDEFQHEGWTILAFADTVSKEFIKYYFYLYKDSKKLREIRLEEGSDAKFYLKEVGGSSGKIFSVFAAPPMYEAVKESLKTGLLLERTQGQK